MKYEGLYLEIQREHEKLIKWLIAFDRAWKRYARPRIL